MGQEGGLGIHSHSLIFSPPLNNNRCSYSIENFEIKLSGDHSRGETPVPMPNTEVKPSSADGTACASEWESRSLPGNKD